MLQPPLQSPRTPLTLANLAFIGAETFGAGPAGDITLNVGTLTARGLLEGYSVPGITSSSGSFENSTAGNAGNITIQGIPGAGSPAATVSLLDFSEIRSTILEGSAANAPATITITAHTLALAHGTGIRADTYRRGASGGYHLERGHADGRHSFQKSPVAATSLSLIRRKGMRGTLRFRGSMAPAVRQPT